MGEHDEVSLGGGAQTPGLVRVGATVRRQAHDRSPWVQAPLTHLEEVRGSAAGPGFDAQGREVVSFTAGEVPGSSPYSLTDTQLTRAASLVRLHDATTASTSTGDHEVVGHGDLGPHNTVFRGGEPVAFIDWDRDVRPGRRADDFATRSGASRT